MLMIYLFSTFFCGKKSSKKSHPKKIYSPFSGAAMVNSCTTVASAFINPIVVFYLNTLNFKDSTIFISQQRLFHELCVG